MSDKTVVTKLQTQEGFAAWRIKIVLISMLGNFFFANLSSDMLNLHYSYICDVWGWARTFALVAGDNRVADRHPIQLCSWHYDR